MSIQHLTLAVRGRRALARDEAERRELMRAIARVAGDRLLLPSLVDDHLHAGTRTERPGYLVRDLRRILRNRRPDLELKQAHVEPVGTRSYLKWLVRYLLQQPVKHGLVGHPALWTGCAFQDLVGARLLPGFSLRGLRDELPQLRLRELFQLVDLPPVRELAVDDEGLRRLGAARLVEAAAGVFAVGPDVSASIRSAGVEEARALAAWAGRSAGLSCPDVAHHLGATARTVSRLGQKPLPEAWTMALRRRVGLIELSAQASAPRSVGGAA